MPSKLKYAITLALITAVISGTNNFLSKIAVTVVADPIVFTFLKNGLVAIFLIGLIIVIGKWRELYNTGRKDLLKLLSIGVIGGSIPFILFFSGLSKVPAINAAFIHKTLFIWVALMAVPILKERIGKVQLTALALLFGGNLVFGLPKFSSSSGELMILAATILWAIENIIAKITLKKFSSLLVAGTRMAIGSLVILIVIGFQGNVGLMANLAPVQWGWTLLTSLLLAGYVLTWYTALKYAPATLVASLLVPAIFITNFLTAVFITGSLPNEQLTSAILLALGTALLVASAKKILPKSIAPTIKSAAQA